MRRFQILRSLGLEFWLPLPLLGLAFWVGGSFVTDAILSRSYQTTKYLKVDAQSVRQNGIIVVSIKAEIYKPQGFSLVKVRTNSRALKQVEFVFRFTEKNEIEAAISKELGLPIVDVRQLIRYQIKDEK